MPFYQYRGTGECYTEAEVKEKLKGGMLKREDFQRVNVPATLRNECLRKMQAPHPYCQKTFKHVTQFVYNIIYARNVLSADKGDITQELFTRNTSDVYFNIYSPLMGWKALDGVPIANLRESISKLEAGKIYLKCTSESHIFLIIAEKEGDIIKATYILDTAPMPISFNKEKFEKRLGYIFDCEVKKDTTHAVLDETLSMIGLEPAMPLASLQTAEKIISEHGYCNAWLLYFVHSHINGQNLHDIYRTLFAISSTAGITSEIILWWEDMYARSQITLSAT